MRLFQTCLMSSNSSQRSSGSTERRDELEPVELKLPSANYPTQLKHARCRCESQGVREARIVEEASGRGTEDSREKKKNRKKRDRTLKSRSQGTGEMPPRDSRRVNSIAAFGEKTNW